jgi:hypothetical protein
MPMPLRDFLSQNLLWKLGSLVLALLVWSVIQSTIREKTGPQAFLGESRQFVIPITVRTAASDPRGFSIRPNRIAVTLRGERASLADLQESQIDAFVNLVDVAEARELRTRVTVHVPPGFHVAHIEPEEVSVDRLELVPNP